MFIVVEQISKHTGDNWSQVYHFQRNVIEKQGVGGTLEWIRIEICMELCLFLHGNTEIWRRGSILVSIHTLYIIISWPYPLRMYNSGSCSQYTQHPDLGF
jgi:hypothetical protein